MVHTRTSLEAAHASIRLLVEEKLRYLAPMTAIFLTCYIGLTALAAFAKPFVGLKVVGHAAHLKLKEGEAILERRKLLKEPFFSELLLRNTAFVVIVDTTFHSRLLSSV